MTGEIVLRFMTDSGTVAELIRLQAGICVPFTPSHVETLTPDGKFYIGAHLNGGVEARPVGYDSATLMTLPDGSKSERLVRLPCTEEQEDAFYAFAQSKINEPYDWAAIFSFVDPAINLHLHAHLFCSAFMADCIRAPGVQYFPWPMTVPFHHISPRDLFLTLSTHVRIDH